MPIVLPTLPEAALDETSPYCVIAKHRAKPGRADAYERRMLADLENTRAEPGALQFHPRWTPKTGQSWTPENRPVR
jgi:quinol monooxygenase YgiN